MSPVRLPFCIYQILKNIENGEITSKEKTYTKNRIEPLTAIIIQVFVLAISLTPFCGFGLARQIAHYDHRILFRNI